MKFKNTIYRTLPLLGLLLILTGCGKDNRAPGIEYAPEMYHSIPLEPFTQIADSLAPFKDKMNAQIPPEGTIARGAHAAYQFPNSDSGKALSMTLVNPVPFNETVDAEGDVLYQRFCSPCHGKTGLGDGKVSENEAINPVAFTADAVKNRTAGEIYHTIMHGKGVMGSYSTQLDYEERWKVVYQIQKWQGKTPGQAVQPAVAAADTAKPVMKKPVPAKKSKPAGGTKPK